MEDNTPIEEFVNNVGVIQCNHSTPEGNYQRSFHFLDSMANNAIYDKPMHERVYKEDELRYSTTEIRRSRPLFEHLKRGDTFLDLGSGLGFMLLLAMESGAEKAIGIEYCKDRFLLSKAIMNSPDFFLGPKENGTWACVRDFYGKVDNTSLERLKRAVKKIPEYSEEISIIQSDLFDVDLPEADLIYVNIPFKEDNFERLTEKISKEGNGATLAISYSEGLRRLVPSEWKMLDEKECLIPSFLFPATFYLGIFDLNE